MAVLGSQPVVNDRPWKHRIGLNVLLFFSCAIDMAASIHTYSCALTTRRLHLLIILSSGYFHAASLFARSRLISQQMRLMPRPRQHEELLSEVEHIWPRKESNAAAPTRDQILEVVRIGWKDRMEVYVSRISNVPPILEHCRRARMRCG
jgi:hypothetical protein